MSNATFLKRLFIEDEKYSDYKISEVIDNSIDNLNRINIFIGANNSGKSRFLRLLFTDKKIPFELNNINFSQLQETLEILLSRIIQTLTKNGIADSSNDKIPGVKKTLSDFIIKFKKLNIDTVNNLVSDFNIFLNNLCNYQNQGGSHLNNFSGHTNWSETDEEIRKNAGLLKFIIREFIPAELKYENDRLYIPILRGLRPTQLLDETTFDKEIDNYRLRTIRDYFEKDKIPDSEIFTGLRLYQDLKKMLLGKREERNKVKHFEDFLSKTFFDSKTVSLTPSIEDDSVHVLIGDEEWPIYRIGDGIQAIIILLYPLFFNQGKTLLIFIEEPENSMHPGLQRLFLETLMRKEFETFQYFITTHSNHFLDITLELNQVSVFTCEKIKSNKDSKDHFSIQNISNENTQVLDLIGARSSSVFLSNCTIWVEGITDRLYLRKYLEVYQKYLQHQKEIKTGFREDFNYSFVEYSGGNIVHWSFADESRWDTIKSNRISSKILLVADKDNTLAKPNSAKAKRLRLLKKQLGDRFLILNGREIENTLSPQIIIETIKSLEKNNFVNVQYQLNKITYENYKESYMGDFITTNFSNLNTRKYKADSGTLYCKLDFCKTAIIAINDFEDLSKEGKDIAKKLFNFIRTCNHEI